MRSGWLFPLGCSKRHAAKPRAACIVRTSEHRGPFPQMPGFSLGSSFMSLLLELVVFVVPTLTLGSSISETPFLCLSPRASTPKHPSTWISETRSGLHFAGKVPGSVRVAGILGIHDLEFRNLTPSCLRSGAQASRREICRSRGESDVGSCRFVASGCSVL